MYLPNNVITSCKRGNKNDVLKFLQKNGKKALQYTVEDSGQSLLHISCEEGHEELVNLILSEKYKHSIDINVIDNNGWTPLHSACKGGNIQVIELLLKKGAFVRALTNEGSSPLHYFVRNEHTEENSVKFQGIISQLVKKGGIIDFQNTHGETACHQAAIRGRFLTLQFLINSSANINLTTKFVFF